MACSGGSFGRSSSGEELTILIIKLCSNHYGLKIGCLLGNVITWKISCYGLSRKNDAAGVVANSSLVIGHIV